MADSKTRSKSTDVELSALQATALEQMTEAVYIRGPDRRLLYINPAAEEMSGYALDEALKLPCYRIFGDPGAHCNKNCPIDRAVGTGEPLRHLEGSVVNRAGEEKTVDVTVAPVSDPDSPASAIVILRDTSKLRELEKQSGQGPDGGRESEPDR